MTAAPRTDGRFARATLLNDLPGGARLQTLAAPGSGTVVIHGSLRAGAALDTPERSGLAELTARALDLGTSRRTRLQIATELDGRGVTFRFWGGNLTAAFSARCLTEDLALCLEALFEMLRDPVFPEDELTKLKLRAAAQIRESADSTHAMAYESFYRALYPDGHPLWIAPIEKRLAALEGLQRDHLVKFHRESYGPRDLLLTVVGDFEPDAPRARIEGLLRGWKGPLRRTEPWQDVGRPGAPPPGRLDIKMPGKSNIDVVWGHRCALRRMDDDYLPAVLGNLALGGSTLSSRLGLRVRDREGLTYGIYSRFNGATLAPAPWSVSVTVAPENLDKALRSTREVVDGTIAKGIESKELRGEQEHMVGGFLVGLATNDGIARQIHDAGFYGFGPGYLDRFPALVRDVTRDQVMAALRRHVRPPECVAVAAGPV